MLAGASSGGAPALGNLPTVVVGLGEAPLGDIAVQEVVQWRGVGGS
jgi:hypothetical protein